MSKLPVSPCVIVITGAPKHGKSILAKHLAERFKLLILDPDHICKSLFPSMAKASPRAQEEMRKAAYTFTVQATELNLAVGQAVILPATFARDTYKAPLLRLEYLVGHSYPFHCFHLEIPEDNREQMVRHRLQKEYGFDTPLAKYLRQYYNIRAETTPWPADSIEVTELDACLQLGLMLEEVMNHVPSLKRGLPSNQA